MDDIQVAAEAAAAQVVEKQSAVAAAEQAEVAAESAVLAAETAIAMANTRSAVAQIQAAEEVREVVQQVEEQEVTLSWLNERLTAHQSADLTEKTAIREELSRISEAILLLTQSTVSTGSPSSTPQESEVIAEVVTTAEVVPETQEQAAQNAGGADPLAPASESGRPKKKRRLL
jgi:hypothetical protein